MSIRYRAFLVLLRKFRVSFLAFSKTQLYFFSSFSMSAVQISAVQDIYLYTWYDIFPELSFLLLLRLLLVVSVFLLFAWSWCDFV